MDGWQVHVRRLTWVVLSEGTERDRGGRDVRELVHVELLAAPTRYGRSAQRGNPGSRSVGTPPLSGGCSPLRDKSMIESNPQASRFKQLAIRRLVTQTV